MLCHCVAETSQQTPRKLVLAHLCNLRASSALPAPAGQPVGVDCVTSPEDDRDTLQRFAQPFINQPDKKIATRHFETSNVSTTRENDLSPLLRGNRPTPAARPIPVQQVFGPVSRAGANSITSRSFGSTPFLRVKSVRRLGSNPSPLADFTPYAHQRRTGSRVAKKYRSPEASQVCTQTRTVQGIPSAMQVESRSACHSSRNNHLEFEDAIGNTCLEKSRIGCVWCPPSAPGTREKMSPGNLK